MFTVPRISTVPRTSCPDLGALSDTRLATQPSPVPAAVVGSGVRAMAVASSAEMVPVGVESRSGVGVATNKDAGRLGKTNEATMNSAKKRNSDQGQRCHRLPNASEGELPLETVGGMPPLIPTAPQPAKPKQCPDGQEDVNEHFVCAQEPIDRWHPWAAYSSFKTPDTIRSTLGPRVFPGLHHFLVSRDRRSIQVGLIADA